MMIPIEVLDVIQCYGGKIKHIIREPILLQCGHSACKSCILENPRFRCNYPNCQFLNEFNDEKLFKEVKSIENLIESYLHELYTANANEYDAMLKSIEDEACENVIDHQCERIKSVIIERSEFLKNQIDNYTENLCKKLEIKKRKLKRLIRYEEKEITPYKNINFELTKDEFYSVQTKLLELKQIIKEFSSNDGNPYFELNKTSFDESIIGNLYLTSCDSIFLKHKILTNENPFSHINFTSEPYGVCAVNNAYLCVTFPHLGKMCVFSDEFKLLGTVDKIMDASLNCPRGITSDGCDQIVICDSYCHRLIITDTSFESLKILGKFGAGQGEFYSPFDVHFHNRHLYVCDTGNKRVQKFTDNFAYLRTFELKYYPVEIRIFNQMAIIRDDSGFLYFHDLIKFHIIKKTKTVGAIGLVGKCLYQVNENNIYYYNSKGVLDSKTKINCELELNRGSTCFFKKDFILTGKEKLYIIENVL